MSVYVYSVVFTLQFEAFCVMSDKVTPTTTAAHTPLLCEHFHPFMSLKPCLKLIMHGPRPPKPSPPYARTCRMKHGSHRFHSTFTKAYLVAHLLNPYDQPGSLPIMCITNCRKVLTVWHSHRKTSHEWAALCMASWLSMSSKPP